MGLISILFNNPVLFIVLCLCLLYSIIFHEVAHGLAALFFGDDTARRSGRLTLNPIVHIDPVGTILLLFVGFGWAKPVPVNYGLLRNQRLGLFCVSLAGCFVNIMIAIFSEFFRQMSGIGLQSDLASLLLLISHINIMLASFNLIPIPPLDGSKILMSILPVQMQIPLSKVERYGLLILMILIYTRILDPVINGMDQQVFNLVHFIVNFLK